MFAARVEVHAPSGSLWPRSSDLLVMGLFDALAHVDAEEGTAAAPATASRAVDAALAFARVVTARPEVPAALAPPPPPPPAAPAASAKKGTKERQYTEEDVREAARRIVASARRGRTMTAGASAAEQRRPSMKNVLSRLMLKVWAIDEGPTALVDKWLARDDFIGAYTFPTKGNAAVCAPIFSSDDDKFLKLACDWSAWSMVAGIPEM